MRGVISVAPCNPVALETRLGNSVSVIPVEGNIPSIGEWIVLTSVIQHMQCNELLSILDYISSSLHLHYCSNMILFTVFDNFSLPCEKFISLSQLL